MLRLRQDLGPEDVALGFTSENDIFRRRDLASRLTGLFEQLEGGSVCLLDGRWGSGKTTFVKQWAAELRKVGRPVVYFDAFASDYIDSPFEALAAAFIQEASSAGKSSRKEYKDFLRKAAAVGKMVSGVAAKAGVKAATLGVVGNDEIEALGKAGEALIEGFSDVAEKAVETMLEEHANSIAKFEALKNSISRMPRLLTPDEEHASASLLVFIDELDRCRPDFSLGILETLKHFFRADGIHFVLVTNRAHLELSVAQRYGVGGASREYLEKFFDFSVQLDVSWDKYDPHGMHAFIRRLTGRLLPRVLEDGRYIADGIEQVCDSFRLSLRESETFIINVALSLLSAREREFRPAMLIAYLCIMKVKSPGLFAKAKNGHLKYQDFAEFISLHGSYGDGPDVHAMKVFRYYSDPDIDVNSDEYHGWGRELWNYNLERSRVVPYLASHVVERFGAPSEIFA